MWPDLHRRRDRATKLLTTGGCDTDADANKLGVIRLPQGKRGRPARNPLHLGHLAAQIIDRRGLVRVSRLVQGSPPELDQNPVRVQPSGVAAEPHRAPQQAKSKLEARWL